jgi:hypothetical protein
MPINTLHHVPGHGTFPYVADINTPTGKPLPISSTGEITSSNNIDVVVTELIAQQIQLTQKMLEIYQAFAAGSQNLTSTAVAQPSAVVTISPQAMNLLASAVQGT